MAVKNGIKCSFSDTLIMGEIIGEGVIDFIPSSLTATSETKKKDKVRVIKASNPEGFFKYWKPQKFCSLLSLGKVK